MDSVIEAKVRDFLKNWLQVNVNDLGTIVGCIRNLARAAGYEVDENFGRAGLAAGPEAEVASAIVGQALHCGATPVSDYQMRQEIGAWTRRNPRKLL